MHDDDKSVRDLCFPIPKNFSLSIPEKVDARESVKKYIFQQTVQTAYQRKIPYNFSSTYNRESPHQLATDEEIENVVSLFQAVQPQDAVELALTQQFIVTHIQTMNAVNSSSLGMNERDIKRLELTHQILETLMRYRSKGAQQIHVNYNQSQVNNIRVVKSKKKSRTIEVENELC